MCDPEIYLKSVKKNRFFNFCYITAAAFSSYFRKNFKPQPFNIVVIIPSKACNMAGKFWRENVLNK